MKNINIKKRMVIEGTLVLSYEVNDSPVKRWKDVSVSHIFFCCYQELFIYTHLTLLLLYFIRGVLWRLGWLSLSRTRVEFCLVLTVRRVKGI